MPSKVKKEVNCKKNEKENKEKTSPKEKKESSKKEKNLPKDKNAKSSEQKIEEIIPVVVNPLRMEITPLYFNSFDVPPYLILSEPTVAFKKWYWSPASILLTTWGDLWISDPPRFKIHRYNFNEDYQFTKLLSLDIWCECYSLIEVEKSIIFGICQKNDRKGLLKIDCNTGAIARIWDSQPVVTEEMEQTEEKVFEQFNANEIIGLATDFTEFLYIVYAPLQKLRPVRVDLAPVDYKIEGNVKEIELMTTGSVAATLHYVCVLVNNPPRIIMLSVKNEKVYRMVDFLILRIVRTIGEHQLLQPHSLAMDKVGTIVVTESELCYVRLYTKEGKYVGCVGGKNPIRPKRPTHVCISKHGSLCFMEEGTNTVIIYANLNHSKTYCELQFNSNFCCIR